MEALDRAFTSRTKAIIINNPCNPIGKVVFIGVFTNTSLRFGGHLSFSKCRVGIGGGHKFLLGSGARQNVDKRTVSGKLLSLMTGVHRE